MEGAHNSRANTQAMRSHTGFRFVPMCLATSTPAGLASKRLVVCDWTCDNNVSEVAVRSRLCTGYTLKTN